MTALPPSLDRFGAELENAVGRDLRSRRTRRRMVRGAAVLAAASAAALGLLSGLTGGGPSVVQRAAAALESSDPGILHYQIDAEQQNGDGTSVTWHSETWQLRVAPFTRRQIEVGADGIRAESVTQGDTNELYDARTGTIYIATSQQLRAARMPKIEIVSKSKLQKLTGSSHVSAAYLMTNGAGAVKVIATAEGAKRLRRQIARERAQESAGVLPAEFRSDILALLGSGRVRVTGRVTVDGREQFGSSRSTGRRSTWWTRRPTTRSSGRPRGTAAASLSASRSTSSYRWRRSR